MIHIKKKNKPSNALLPSSGWGIKIADLMIYFI